MPRQQTVKQQAQDAATAVSNGASNAAGYATDAAAAATEKVKEAASSIIGSAPEPQGAIQSAKNAAQSYAEEGQRIASEQKQHLQDAAKKAFDAAQDYVDDARKAADPYVETAKGKFESAKAAAGNARETAQHAVDNAKDQASAVREKVLEKAQPYVKSVQAFDVTKTAAFHVLTHLISIYLYVIWRVLQLVPPANHVVKVLQQKENDIAVASNCANLVQQVPVVGPRTVEITTVAAKSVRTDLNEQIAQYQASSSKKSA